MRIFVAPSPASPIKVISTSKGKGRSRTLKNWHRIDNCLRDAPRLTWGYVGTGPFNTSYSILRELYGKKTAERMANEFLRQTIAILPEREGFSLSEEHVNKALETMISKWIMGSVDKRIDSVNSCPGAEYGWYYAE